MTNKKNVGGLANIAEVRDRTKKEILSIWMKNVYKNEIKKIKSLFAGCCGHQLEQKFGLKNSNKNESDFKDFELKIYSSRITFGDWKGKFLFEKNPITSRLDFLEYFGRYNSEKKNYYLTSPAVPKFTEISYRGFFWKITAKKLKLLYNPKKDTKKPKRLNFPNNTVLVVWDLESLKKKFDNKFSGKQIILAKKENGIHTKILFVNSLDWPLFLKWFKQGIIILDPCLKSKDKRNHCSFRINATNLLNLGYTEYSVSNEILVKKYFSKKVSN